MLRKTIIVKLDLSTGVSQSHALQVDFAATKMTVDAICYQTTNVGDTVPGIIWCSLVNDNLGILQAACNYSPKTDFTIGGRAAGNYQFRIYSDDAMKTPATANVGILTMALSFSAEPKIPKA